MSKHRYKPGDLVEIEGEITYVVNFLCLHDVGYQVYPPVHDIIYWNEDEVNPVTEIEEKTK